MLNRLYLYIRAHRGAAISFFAAWLLIALYAVTQLRFEEDITKVLPQSDKANLTAKVFKQLNFADKISVIVSRESQGDLLAMQSLAEKFHQSVQNSLTNYIAGVQGIVDEESIDQTWQFVYDHLPLFLEEPDYQYLSARLPVDSLTAMVETHYKTMLSPAGMVAQNFLRTDPFGLTFRGLQKLQKLNLSNDFKITNTYLTTADEQHLLFFLNLHYGLNDAQHNQLLVERLDLLQDQLNAQFAGRARIDCFGAPFVSVSNAQQIKTDILTTVLLSLSALYLLLVFFYRSTYLPLIAFIPSVFGVLTALATLYLLKGTISAISISLGAVLLGVTIDYSLHILTHYKCTQNTAQLYKAVTAPILLSSSTTAISFLCLLFVHSDVMRDLGLFASVGIMVSALLSLVCVPHFYRANRTLQVRKTLLDRVGAYPFHKNRWVVGACLLLIGASFFTFQNVRFDSDISHANYLNPRYQKGQQLLESLSDSHYASLYATAYGNSQEEALERNYALYQQLQHYKATDTIKQFSSVAAIVLPQAEQHRRIVRWQQFWSLERQEALRKHLLSAGNALGFKESTYSPFFQHLQHGFQTIPLSTYAELSAIPLSDFITEKDGFYTIANLVKLPAEQRNAFIASVERNTPTVVIDRKQLSETFLGKLKDDILLLVNYSSVAIFLILLLFFRRIELVLLTLIPIGVTGIVTAGLMSFFGIEFNVFSMIVCTLVLGHSVDFSIFMTCALQKEYTTGHNELPVYKVSVLLASITTFLAIGTLIFAKHPALQSIASVSLIGIFTALVITFVFYPSLFRWFIFRRPQRGSSPISLHLLIASLLSIFYYGLMSLLLSYAAWLWLKVFPKSTPLFRRGTNFLGISALYTRFSVSKQIENPENNTLSTPCIVIANHSSWLDNLSMGMFSTKLTYMVNQWVYRSPIFGRLLRAIGYLPAADGIEKTLPLVRQQLEQGFSVVVFPEGKRSETNQIHRFHQGAFYLAQQCGVPLLPVYLHGTSEVLPKNDFVIYSGSITLQVGTPILPTDLRWGSSPRERAKNIGAHFRTHFADLRRRLEGVDYLKQKLFLNYLYKTNEVVSAVKTDYLLNRQKYYELSQSLPSKARILRYATDVNDYGQLDFLLLLTYPERSLTTVLPDPEKRAIAQQSYLTRIRSLRYLSDPPEEEIFDVILPIW